MSVVRIIKVLLKKIYHNFVGTLEPAVRNREVSVQRGSAVFTSATG